MIWGYLIHLGRNNWEDHSIPGVSRSWGDTVLWDDRVWDEMLPRMKDAGVTLVILDLGDGIRTDSHPEIGIKKAWSTDRLRSEVARLRDLGFEPIPKLNFSTTHSAWMGEYRRCVATPRYYRFCEDLIREVADLFDRPRFFHLGMDEETAAKQKNFRLVVVRQRDLWWNDLAFYCDQVGRAGARPWIWSDYAWAHPRIFFQKMPKTVVQSNWYYGADFSPHMTPAQTYADLEAHGYDQIPTGSNFYRPENFAQTVEHSRRIIAPERLLGFLQTPWKGPRAETRQHHFEAIAQLAAARKKHER